MKVMSGNIKVPPSRPVTMHLQNDNGLVGSQLALGVRYSTPHLVKSSPIEAPGKMTSLIRGSRLFWEFKPTEANVHVCISIITTAEGAEGNTANHSPGLLPPIRRGLPPTT
ncbi:uncharacterized protein LOC111247073 isoform X1 [Varroa destructor]|uniref:Uncharacterized protein n=1 Tax=Varroa destructor TaxID=109461 RepID=A0A7M7JKJ7_VARDE|nr:uncharacterized protein LOC111247073 isoform X1 [Varroa destructor]XP_022653356.1 uncharacterized protein LOC111247073 isoform X1 [Varroa destructor]